MRLVSIAMISLVCACPGRRVDGPGMVGPSAEVSEFRALAWVPDRPTYLMTAHTVREAQQSVGDVIDSLGMLAGVTADDLGHELGRVLGIDPLSAAGTAQLGVDPEGSIAMFSEATDPTIVVRLATPETAQAYFEAAKGRVRTQSVVVDKVEVTTATVVGKVHASWAIDRDWLWVHFAFGLDQDPDATWFAHAHHAADRAPGGGAWARNFGWATKVREKLASHAGLLGFIDAPALFGLARVHAPKDALACLDRFTPIGIAGFAFEGDGRHAAGRIALDLGPAGAGIAGALVPPPPGFAAIAAKAPVAVQWNLDASAIASFLAPCVAMGGGSTQFITKYGVRTARLVIQTLNPGDKSGTGVIATDLSDKTYLAGLLDQVPKRSLFESNHRFGAIAGHRISIPFVATVDYVLDDRLGLVAMGDGLMDALVMGAAPAGPPPVFSLDLIVAGLSAEAWHFLIEAATGEWFAKRATEHLQRWHDGHLSVTIDHESLVIDASGNRR